MIIFTLRRFLLLLVTLFFLTFIGFSLSYFTPHAPLQGASLWNAWVFWFNGLIHWDFWRIQYQRSVDLRAAERGVPATMELCILAFGFALMVWDPRWYAGRYHAEQMAGPLHQRIGSDGVFYPRFWLALLLTLLFSLTLGWLPVSGRFDLLYEVKPVTGFAIIDAWISDSASAR